MAKQKGTPHYTRHTVAWPDQSLRRTVVEEVGISFAAKGGGTYAELIFLWHDFSSVQATETQPALQVTCFAESFGALLDPRIACVIATLNRLPERERDVTPERVISLLEAEGVLPSMHHLKGMIELGLYDSYESKAELQKKLDRQRAWESA